MCMLLGMGVCVLLVLVESYKLFLKKGSMCGVMKWLWMLFMWWFFCVVCWVM